MNPASQIRGAQRASQMNRASQASSRLTSPSSSFRRRRRKRNHVLISGCGWRTSFVQYRVPEHGSQNRDDCTYCTTPPLMQAATASACTLPSLIHAHTTARRCVPRDRRAMSEAERSYAHACHTLTSRCTAMHRNLLSMLGPARSFQLPGCFALLVFAPSNALHYRSRVHRNR